MKVTTNLSVVACFRCRLQKGLDSCRLLCSCPVLSTQQKDTLLTPISVILKVLFRCKIEIVLGISWVLSVFKVPGSTHLELCRNFFPSFIIFAGSLYIYSLNKKILAKMQPNPCNLLFWFQLPPATKAPRSRPSPCRGAEDNGKKTGRKPVGRDKGSLTEQQTEGTVTTMIQIRRKYDPNSHNRPSLPDRTGAAHSPAASEFPLRHPLRHRNPAWRHMLWNTGLCLARWGQPPPPGCAPSWSPVKINPVLAKPRTSPDSSDLQI